MFKDAWKELKHYLAVYQKFAATSFTEAMSFRTSFVLLVLMDIFFYFSSLATVSFIYDHVETIGPWNRSQLMFFISFMLAVDHLHMTFISESFWMMARQIKTGDMDFILLRPLHSIFSVFFRHVRASSLFNTPVVWGVLIYYGRALPLEWYQWVLIPPLLIAAFILLALIEFLVSTSMFWMTEGMGINFLRMQMQSLSRWPDFIYQGISKRIFTVAVPLLLIGSAPVHFLYDFQNWHYLVGMGLAIVILWKVLLVLWRIALRRYESASS